MPSPQPFSDDELRTAFQWLTKAPDVPSGTSVGIQTATGIVAHFQRREKLREAVAEAGQDFLDHQGHKLEPEKWKVLREKVSALQADGGGK